MKKAAKKKGYAVKIASTICFALAVITLYVAVMNIAKGPPHDPNMTQAVQNAQVIGYIIGSLIFPVVLLVVGLIFKWFAARKDAPIVATLVNESSTKSSV